MSFSSNSNKLTPHRRFLFNKPNQRSPLLQSLSVPVSSSLVGIDPFASSLLLSVLSRASTKEMSLQLLHTYVDTGAAVLAYGHWEYIMNG